TTLEQKLLARPLDETEALKLIMQVMEGLAAAHEQRVIHCDIKPSNLRVTPDGRVKILDFGLAKFLKHANAESLTMSLAEDHGVAGTLGYMAPEQLRGNPPDERTDTYAVGCVLYEMTTGQRPFPGTTAALIIDNILNKALVHPTSITPTVSPGIEFVILKSLEKDPACRYQSAKEMLANLRRVSTSTFTPPAANRRASRVAMRRTIWRPLAFAILLGCLVYAVSYLSLRRAAVDSIAILPLTNMSGSSETEYLSDGITDALIN